MYTKDVHQGCTQSSFANRMAVSHGSVTVSQRQQDAMHLRGERGPAVGGVVDIHRELWPRRAHESAPDAKMRCVCAGLCGCGRRRVGGCVGWVKYGVNGSFNPFDSNAALNAAWVRRAGLTRETECIAATRRGVVTW